MSCLSKQILAGRRLVLNSFCCYCALLQGHKVAVQTACTAYTAITPIFTAAVAVGYIRALDQIPSQNALHASASAACLSLCVCQHLKQEAGSLQPLVSEHVSRESVACSSILALQKRPECNARVTLFRVQAERHDIMSRMESRQQFTRQVVESAPLAPDAEDDR